MARINSEDALKTNFLIKETEIKGDIKATGNFRLEGYVEGNIEIDGRLSIGPTGEIKGNIKCTDADCSGRIEGKFTVKNKLILKSEARVKGDLFITQLAIEPGAIFSGNCNMEDNINKPNLPKEK